MQPTPRDASLGSTGTNRATPVHVDLWLGSIPLASLAAATWGLLELPASYPFLVAALYVSLVALLLRGHPGAIDGHGLGAANRITFGRALLALPVMALVPFHGHVDAAGQWWIILLATAVMVLDGADGALARRSGTESSFGARFDMELDAALILALSALVWLEGKTGSWILLVGALRYLFVGAGVLWPVLTRELPESPRRKTVCVIQGVALLVCLGPIIPEWLATACGATALLLLVHSFGRDVRWLMTTGSGRTARM